MPQTIVDRTEEATVWLLNDATFIISILYFTFDFKL